MTAEEKHIEETTKPYRVMSRAEFELLTVGSPVIVGQDIFTSGIVIKKENNLIYVQLPDGEKLSYTDMFMQTMSIYDTPFRCLLVVNPKFTAKLKSPVTYGPLGALV